jgi:hypothetical protein
VNNPWAGFAENQSARSGLVFDLKRGLLELVVAFPKAPFVEHSAATGHQNGDG